MSLDKIHEHSKSCFTKLFSIELERPSLAMVANGNNSSNKYLKPRFKDSLEGKNIIQNRMRMFEPSSDKILFLEKLLNLIRETKTEPWPYGRVNSEESGKWRELKIDLLNWIEIEVTQLTQSINESVSEFEDLFKNHNDCQKYLSFLYKVKPPLTTRDFHYIKSNKYYRCFFAFKRFLEDIEVISYISDEYFKTLINKKIIGLDIKKNISSHDLKIKGSEYYKMFKELSTKKEEK